MVFAPLSLMLRFALCILSATFFLGVARGEHENASPSGPEENGASSVSLPASPLVLGRSAVRSQRGTTGNVRVTTAGSVAPSAGGTSNAGSPGASGGGGLSPIEFQARAFADPGAYHGNSGSASSASGSDPTSNPHTLFGMPTAEKMATGFVLAGATSSLKAPSLGAPSGDSGKDSNASGGGSGGGGPTSPGNSGQNQSQSSSQGGGGGGGKSKKETSGHEAPSGEGGEEASDSKRAMALREKALGRLFKANTPKPSARPLDAAGIKAAVQAMRIDGKRDTNFNHQSHSSQGFASAAEKYLRAAGLTPQNGFTLAQIRVNVSNGSALDSKDPEKQKQAFADSYDHTMNVVKMPDGKYMLIDAASGRVSEPFAATEGKNIPKDIENGFIKGLLVDVYGKKIGDKGEESQLRVMNEKGALEDRSPEQILRETQELIAGQSPDPAVAKELGDAVGDLREDLRSRGRPALTQE